ncbi:hypothetical protein ACFLT7_01785 [candidate division KSB1 bacterium]
MFLAGQWPPSWGWTNETGRAEPATTVIGASMEREQRQWILGRERGEFNRSPAARLTVGLVYPNRYGVAMSNLGYQTVAAMVSGHPEYRLERFFLPPLPLPGSKKGGGWGWGGDSRSGERHKTPRDGPGGLLGIFRERLFRPG